MLIRWKKPGGSSGMVTTREKKEERHIYCSTNTSKTRRRIEIYTMTGIIEHYGKKRLQTQNKDKEEE